MKNTKEDTNKWGGEPRLQIKILSKCSYYPKPSINSMQLLSKLQGHFSTKVCHGIKRETQTNGLESRAQKQALTYIVNEYLISESRILSEEKIVSSINLQWENLITTRRR